MYICICNAITESMLEETDYYYHLVGSECGKCIEQPYQYTCGQVTYLTETKDKQQA